MLRQSQKMEAVGQLTGGVAHDFNNLLTVVVGNLELLDRRTRRRPESGTPSRAPWTAPSARRDLTRQLLAFARKQPLRARGRRRQRPRRRTGELLTHPRRARSSSRLPSIRRVGPIAVDRNQIENALLNLTVNARDAMPEGGRLTIRTGRRRGRGATAARPSAAGRRYVLIEVADTGTGMPPEVAERVFEPFFTTKPVGRGTGLGLSQVYGFVKQSHGHLDLATRPGAGTTVRIVLPLATEVPRPRHGLGHDDRSEPCLRAMRPTVLMVEDEMLLGHVVADELEEAGYRVLVVTTGEEALAFLERAEPSTSSSPTSVCRAASTAGTSRGGRPARAP